MTTKWVKMLKNNWGRVLFYILIIWSWIGNILKLVGGYKPDAFDYFLVYPIVILGSILVLFSEYKVAKGGTNEKSKEFYQLFNYFMVGFFLFFIFGGIGSKIMSFKIENPVLFIFQNIFAGICIISAFAAFYICCFELIKTVFLQFLRSIK